MTEPTESTDRTVIELGSNIRVGANVSYGEKVTLAGAEVLPVAIGFYGFGGGGSLESRGSGGGGGSWSVPLGAYVGHGNSVVFEPNIIILSALSIPIICATGFATARVIHALRR